MATAKQGRKENAVISINVISLALEEQLKDQPSQTSLARPAIKLHEATSLQLSFKNLLRIENLNILHSLKKLQLDNNSISRIENLESLVNLEWLDLSFNRIKKLENLSHLTSLRDLSLFSNEITVVEALDGLNALQCLSLGNNLISDLDAVLAFRRLPSLEALTLEGNPLCKPQEGSRVSYTVFCHAFLPKLSYLDYRMITAAEKGAARDGGVPAEKLSEVEEKSAAEDKAANAATERAALIARLYSSNLEMAESFPEELFSDEPEFSKLRSMGMPGLDPLVKALGEALSGPASDLKDLGGDKDLRIQGEIGQFEEAVADELSRAQADSSAAADKWYTSMKHAVRDVSARTAAGNNSHAFALTLVSTLQASADALADVLLRREIETHESIEAMLDVFDSAMSELRASKLVQHDVYFRALEGQVALFAEGMQKHAERMVSDADADRLPHGLDEELVALLNDKEALMAVLAGSAEARVSRILKREGELRAREERRCNGAVQDARRGELARNRARVLEIRAMTVASKARAEEGILAVAGEEDEDGKR